MDPDEDKKRFATWIDNHKFEEIFEIICARHSSHIFFLWLFTLDEANLLLINYETEQFSWIPNTSQSQRSCKYFAHALPAAPHTESWIGWKSGNSRHRQWEALLWSWARSHSNHFDYFHRIGWNAQKASQVRRIIASPKTREKKMIPPCPWAMCVACASVCVALCLVCSFIRFGRKHMFASVLIPFPLATPN